MRQRRMGYISLARVPSILQLYKKASAGFEAPPNSHEANSHQALGTQTHALDVRGRGVWRSASCRYSCWSEPFSGNRFDMSCEVLHKDYLENLPANSRCIERPPAQIYMLAQWRHTSPTPVSTTYHVYNPIPTAELKWFAALRATPEHLRRR